MKERSVLKIGEFARVAQVSLATLRHYEKLGLLKPMVLDPDTGYRYYSLDQLSRLNRILALKDLGFSLERIAQILLDGGLGQSYGKIAAYLEQQGVQPGSPALLLLHSRSEQRDDGLFIDMETAIIT